MYACVLRAVDVINVKLPPSLVICGLSQLVVSVAALSEVTRPGSGKISGGRLTYYWSGSPQWHRKEVAVAVADRLVHMIT